MRTFHEMLIAFGDTPIPYFELLSTVEWKERRKTILERDGCKCVTCHSDGMAARLEVHHRIYIQQRLPWDYSDEWLATLCDKCHKELHEETKVIVYREENGELIPTNLRWCRKCFGTGYIPKFKLRDHGVCYDCRGKGFADPIDVAALDVLWQRTHKGKRIE